MLSPEPDLVDRHETLLLASPDHLDRAIANEYALLQILLPAIEQNTCWTAARHFHGEGIVGVDHRIVLICLVEKDLLLGLEVILKLVIAILMIGTHIEDECNVTLEFLDVFQLKGREFNHKGRFGRSRGCFDPLDEG